MPTSDWLIGSYPDMPSQTLAITVPSGSNSEAANIPAGDYYLHHTTDAISLCDQLSEALQAHGSIGGDTAKCELMQDGKVRVWTTGSTTFGITWTSTDARDMYGFTDNLSGNYTYTASKSAYWWSGNRKASPTMSPLGIVGAVISDAVVGMAGDATQRVTENNTYRANNYFWRYVPVARVWTSAEAGGEYFAFHDNVIRKGRQFVIWPDIAEADDQSDTTITLANALGPYKAPIGWDYGREIANVDKLSRIDLPVTQVTELT